MVRSQTHSPLTTPPPVRLLIINLAKSSERREQMERMLAPLNLHYEFVEGVDGNKLSADYIQEVNRRAHVFQKIWKRPLTVGEIGCAMSHLKCYEKIVSEQIPHSIIMEDDIFLLHPHAFLAFCQHIEMVAQTYELVFLGFSNWSVPLDEDPLKNKNVLRLGKNTPLPTTTLHIGKPTSFCWSATGYFLSLSGAEKMAKNVAPIRTLSDVCTGNAERFGVLVGVFNRPLLWSNEESLHGTGSTIKDRKFIHPSLFSRIITKLSIRQFRIFEIFRTWARTLQVYLAKYHICPYKTYRF